MSTVATSDGTALLRAICEQPGEDVPRLMYADWLDEQGKDRRAGFVRDCVTNWPVVADFERELLALIPGMKTSGFGKEDDADGGRPYWRFGLPGGWVVKLLFSRGFVSHIELPCAHFLKSAETLFRAHPVTSVLLRDSDPLECGDDANPGPFRWLKDRPESRYWTNWWIPPQVWAPELDVEFPTVAVAHAALSAALVTHGRKLAGLAPPPA